MCDIILRETNRKGRLITETWNQKLLKGHPAGQRPSQRNFCAFTTEEFDVFLGILIVCGVHRSNKEHVSELWKLESMPLVRAAMCRDRYKMLLRFIRFDIQNTRAERIKIGKAAPIQDIWLMLNKNLAKRYTSSKCLTVDEQLFPYRGHTKFTQYILSKPAKYGIKDFWVCDAAYGYPLQGKLSTRKLPEKQRQKNVGKNSLRFG